MDHLLRKEDLLCIIELVFFPRHQQHSINKEEETFGPAHFSSSFTVPQVSHQERHTSWALCAVILGLFSKDNSNHGKKKKKTHSISQVVSPAAPPPPPLLLPTQSRCGPLILLSMSFLSCMG